jgi:hypothetical protein
LLDIIEKQQRTIKRLAANERRLIERLTPYEPQALRETTTNQANSNTPTASYSLDSETKRRQRRHRRKKSPGRQPTAVKFADAEQVRNVYPDGICHKDCQLVRERAVWRIEDGKAVLRVHDPDLVRAVALAEEGDLAAVGGPGQLRVRGRIVREVDWIRAIGIHDVDFLIAVSIAGESDPGAVGREDGLISFAESFVSRT